MRVCIHNPSRHVAMCVPVYMNVNDGSSFDTRADLEILCKKPNDRDLRKVKMVN